MQKNLFRAEFRNLSRLGIGVMVCLLAAISTTLMAGTVDRLSLSAGCTTKTIPHTGVFNVHGVDGNNNPRTYLVQVPPDYSNTNSYSLVFVFHGAGGSSAQSYSWGLQNATGAAETAIFVFPQGIPYQIYGVGWDDTNRGYDMPFFDNMLSTLESSYCINTSQVFAAGFSWGGDFLTSLVCNRGDALAAVEINSSGDEYTNDRNYLSYYYLPCPAKIRPAIRYEHASGGDSAYPAPEFSTTSMLFRYFEQCDLTHTTVHSSTKGTLCLSYNNCSKQYVECAFNPSIDHALPPNWVQDTWSFFMNLPPPVCQAQ